MFFEARQFFWCPFIILNQNQSQSIKTFQPKISILWASEKRKKTSRQVTSGCRFHYLHEKPCKAIQNRLWKQIGIFFSKLVWFTVKKTCSGNWTVKDQIILETEWVLFNIFGLFLTNLMITIGIWLLGVVRSLNLLTTYNKHFLLEKYNQKIPPNSQLGNINHINN